MYIRPLVNVHRVAVIMSYVQRKKCYHTDLLLLGSRLFKNTVLFCTKEKVRSHLKRWKSIGAHGNQTSQSNTFYYAQYPDFLKAIQILACLCYQSQRLRYRTKCPSR